MVLLLLLSLLAGAGPVEDGREVLSRHARGRDTTPLIEAASALTEAQARAVAPKNAETYALIASLHLSVAEDGPPTERATAVRAALDALDAGRGAGSHADLGAVAGGLAVLVTPTVRRARTEAERATWVPLAGRLFDAMEGLTPPPPATLRGQLAQALAPRVVEQDVARAALLGRRAAALGHPSKSVDLKVADALSRGEDPVAALAYAEEAAGRWPGTWELHDLAGISAATARRFDAASAHFDKAIEAIHPELERQRAVLHRRRAAARVELGRLDDAIADYAAAEPLDPADTTQRYLWARAHVLSAQQATARLRSTSGDKAALPVAAQTHCTAAVPLLEAVKDDPRLGGPSGQALALCGQVLAAEATDG